MMLWCAHASGFAVTRGRLIVSIAIIVFLKAQEGPWRLALYGACDWG